MTAYSDSATESHDAADREQAIRENWRNGRHVSERDGQWAATHRSILEAALAAFTEHGYHDASMADVARRVGVTRAALYLHFDNKMALITQLVRELPPFLGDGPEVLASVDRDRLRMWMQSVVAWYREHRPLLIAAHQADTFASEFDAYIARMTDRVADRLVDYTADVSGSSEESDRGRTVRLRLMLAQLDWFCTRAVLQGTWDGDVDEGVEALLDLWLAAAD